MKQIISTVFTPEEVEEQLEKFSTSIDFMGNPNRNQIKKISFKDYMLNVKGFKVPNLLNQIIYGYIRKPKALRSYIYAQELLKHEIGTPQPMAYVLCKSFIGLRESYYISEQLDYDLTYRELVTDPSYPNHEQILRAFTRFTYKLHEAGINFLDHSPGNTLIEKKNNSYLFYLVDLNRMKFQEMDFEDRMKNFSRLTPKLEMVTVMADEYASLIGESSEKVEYEMWKETQKFQEKFHRKQRIKRRIKFWKKN